MILLFGIYWVGMINLPTSTCISKAHQQYWCLGHYYDTHKKFTAEKWCDPCREKFMDGIEDGRILTSAKKTRKKRGN